MRAVLLRRMMVLGVCALGVSALYLVPGLAGPGLRVGVPVPAGEPPAISTRPAPDVASTAARASGPTTTATLRELPSTGPDATAPADPSGRPELPAPRDRDGDQAPSADSSPVSADPPTPVAQLSVRSADADQVVLGWAPSSDDSGEVTYRVWLNGYEVEHTSDTGATVRWFNDDAQQQVVVVRAEDRDGNRSRMAATLLLDRPEPTPAPADPSPSPTPAPTDPVPPEPSPSAETTPTQDPQPDGSGATPSAVAETRDDGVQ